MSTDLLFPILPREGRVPIKSSVKIRPLEKEASAKALGEDERQEHDEERHVSEHELYQKVHGRYRRGADDASGEASFSKPQSDDADAGEANQTDTDEEDAREKDDDGIKHLDIYI